MSSKITVNGVPIEIYLGEEKASEAVAAFGASIAEMAKSKGPHKVVDRFDDDGVRVSKRVRYLTPNQIRKEYGVMSKPYKTKLENCLAHLKEQGPSSVMEMSVTLIYKARDVSTIMGRFFRRCPFLVERERIGGNAFLYKLTDEGNVTSVEGMFSHYSKQKKSPRRVKPKPELEHDGLVMDKIDWPKVAPLEEKPQPAGGPAEVVVRVEGEVRITFAFG